MAKKLTGKQETYCQQRAAGENPSAAYRKAYNCLGMKGATINNNAYKLEQRTDIATRINELQAPVIEKMRLSAENLIEGIRKIAESDIRQLFDSDGNPLSIHQLPDDIALAISSLDFTRTTAPGNKGSKPVVTDSVKLKLWSKSQAQEKLMKHLGQYEKHNRQQVQNNLLLAVGKLPDNLLEALIEKLDANASRVRPSGRDIEGVATRLS